MLLTLRLDIASWRLLNWMMKNEDIKKGNVGKEKMYEPKERMRRDGRRGAE